MKRTKSKSNETIEARVAQRITKAGLKLSEGEAAELTQTGAVVIQNGSKLSLWGSRGWAEQLPLDFPETAARTQ